MVAIQSTIIAPYVYIVIRELLHSELIVLFLIGPQVETCRCGAAFTTQTRSPLSIFTTSRTQPQEMSHAVPNRFRARMAE